jgi:hypothetical protein
MTYLYGSTSKHVFFALSYAVIGRHVRIVCFDTLFTAVSCSLVAIQTRCVVFVPIDCLLVSAAALSTNYVADGCFGVRRRLTDPCVLGTMELVIVQTFVLLLLNMNNTS